MQKEQSNASNQRDIAVNQNNINISKLHNNCNKILPVGGLHGSILENCFD